MRVLLIYQFGGSDFQFPGESAPRSVDLANRVAAALRVPVGRCAGDTKWSTGRV